MKKVTITSVAATALLTIGITTQAKTAHADSLPKDKTVDPSDQAVNAAQ